MTDTLRRAPLWFFGPDVIGAAAALGEVDGIDDDLVCAAWQFFEARHTVDDRRATFNDERAVRLRLIWTTQDRGLA